MDGHSRFGPEEIQPLELAQAPSTEAIGQVDSVTGEAFIVRADGTTVPAEAGAPIFLGDVVETGDKGAIGLVFVDDSTFSLSDSGKMTIDEMVYDPATNQGSSLFNVAQGVFTFVSGEIAKTSVDAMQIETPVATIGIRGTSGGGRIFNPLLLDPNSTQPPSGTFSNFRDPVTGQAGEFVVFTPTGSQTLSGVNSMTNVANPFVPPSTPVKIPVAALRAVFGAAVAALPKPPARANQQNQEGGGGNNEGTGGNQQGGNAGDDILTDGDPVEGGDAEAAAAADEAAAAAFNEALAQGLDPGLALALAGEIAVQTTARFGLDTGLIDTFSEQNALDDLLTSYTNFNIGAPVSGFGSDDFLFGGSGAPDDGEGDLGDFLGGQFGELPGEFFDPLFDPFFDPFFDAFALGQEEFFLDDFTDDFFPDLGDIENEFVEILTASTDDDILVGGDGNTSFEMIQGASLGGNDVIDGGAGTDELTLLNLDNGWLRYDPNGAPQATYELDGGNLIGTIDLTSVEQLHVSDGIESFFELSGTTANLNNFGDGVRLEFDTGGLLGFVGAGTSGADTLSMSSGSNDPILDVSLSGGNVAGVIMFGKAGDDTLTGSDGSDIIFGGDDNDILYGNGDSDILVGGYGDDQLSGGAGSDYLNGGDGIDTLTGGEGADEIQLDNDGYTDTVVFTATADFGDAVYGFDAGSGGDIISFSPTTRGTGYQDLSAASAIPLGSSTGFINYQTAVTLYSDAASVASSLSGASFAGSFSAGNNVLFMIGNGVSSGLWYWTDGAATADGLIEQSELNFVANFNGVDNIGSFTLDNVSGAVPANLTFEGTSGVDTLVGGDGNDIFYPLQGDDIVSGGAGNDTFNIGRNEAGTTFASGQTGGSIDGGAGTTDTIYSFTNNDYRGVAITNVERHAMGDNNLSVQFNTSQLGTGKIATFIQASGPALYELYMDSTSFDLTTVGLGHYPNIGTQVVKVYGSTGDDTIVGSQQSDYNITLYGGAGNDTITGGTNNDYLDGEDGSDTYIMTNASDSDTINDTGATGTDTLQVETNKSFSAQSIIGIEDVVLNGANNVIFSGAQISSFSNVTFKSGVTENFNYAVAGGGSLDVSGVTFNNFDSVNDRIYVSGSSSGETYVGNAVAENIALGAGDDDITDGAGADTITGGAGADTIRLSADSTSDTLKYTSADFSAGIRDNIVGSASDGFKRGAGGDILDLDIANTVTNGNGNIFETLASGGTVGADTAVINYTTAIGSYLDAATVATALNTINGLAANDRLFFMTTDNTNSVLWYWDDSSGNGDGVADTGEMTDVSIVAASYSESTTSFTADNFAGVS